MCTAQGDEGPEGTEGPKGSQGDKVRCGLDNMAAFSLRAQLK